jgi:hypothetical protein
VRLHLVSDRAVPLPGVTVTLTPSGSSGRSGADGAVTIPVKGGTYTATVAQGCASDLFVQHVATAHFAVPEGDTVEGTLQVAAVRRVAPAKPSDFEGDGTWHVGQSHRITFATVDRCNNQPARNLSLALTRYEPGPGFKLVGTPPDRTFNDGRGYVDVACTEANAEPSVIANAIGDPRDEADLLDIDMLDRNPPLCMA